MDIITHTLSGVAVGSVLINTTNKSFSFKLGLLFFGAFGALLPDVDVISMWSGFDASFGQWFNLTLTGKEIYSAKLWYSHHAFFHSMAAAILITIFLALCLWLVTKHVHRAKNYTLRYFLNERWSWLFVFFGGYVIHLLEDMLTPSSSWGGVAFWWPSVQYAGGWGHIWWWNNYDVFLLVCGVIAFNLLWSFFRIRKPLKTYIAISIFVIGFLTSAFQVSQRDRNYNYTPTMRYRQLEQKSLEQQKAILGEDLFNAMQKLDRLIPVYF